MFELSKLTLLYVEDELSTIDHLMFYLEDNFKKIIVANNGVEGLKLYKENSSDIDLILSDIQMPKMDGLKMLSEIKKLNSQIPCILTTAYSDSEYLIEAIELGVISYLVKPINIDTLFKKIESVIFTTFEKENLTFLLTKLKVHDKLNMDDFLIAIDKTVDEILQKQVVVLSDNLEYDYSSKLIIQNKQDIILTHQEILLTETLLKYRNHIVPYESLINIISPNLPSIDTLRTNVKSIRKKTNKDIIKNLSGVGYKIDVL